MTRRSLTPCSRAPVRPPSCGKSSVNCSNTYPAAIRAAATSSLEKQSSNTMQNSSCWYLRLFALKVLDDSLYKTPVQTIRICNFLWAFPAQIIRHYPCSGDTRSSYYQLPRHYIRVHRNGNILCIRFRTWVETHGLALCVSFYSHGHRPYKTVKNEILIASYIQMDKRALLPSWEDETLKLGYYREVMEQRSPKARVAAQIINDFSELSLLKIPMIAQGFYNVCFSDIKKR